METIRSWKTDCLCSCEPPGWVPVEKSNKQYCWHASAVDYEARAALVLRPSAGDENMLEITAVPLDDLQEQTLELIGTNVNANPYSKGGALQFHFCRYALA